MAAAVLVLGLASGMALFFGTKSEQTDVQEMSFDESQLDNLSSLSPKDVMRQIVYDSTHSVDVLSPEYVKRAHDFMKSNETWLK